MSEIGSAWTYNPFWFMPGGRLAGDIDDDLTISDWFCGAGGSTDGAVDAGVRPVLASNHWDLAIENHAAVHPDCDHHISDLVEAPASYFRASWGAWFSPECTTWSQARGKRRNFAAVTETMPFVDEDGPAPTEAEIRSRATMETVVAYSRYHRFRYVVVENVVDIMGWGDIGRWYAEMASEGYRHRTLFLNTMFFGVPQSRDRFYAVFWREDVPAPNLDFRPPSWCPGCEAPVDAVQSWKNPRRQYGRYREQYLYRCPACAEVALPLVTPALAAIDLSLPIQRIGDRKKPLAPATMRRIAFGTWRYWGWPVTFDTLRDPKFRDIGAEPLVTQTGRQSQALTYYLPLLVHMRGTDEGQIAGSARGIDEPLGTITGGGFHHGLVDPLVVKNFGGVDAAACMALPAAERPLGSITGVDHHSLLVQAAGNTFDRPTSGYYRVRPSADHPLWTLPGTATTGLVVPVNGGRHGDGGHKVRSVEDPLLTQTGDLARALVYAGQHANRTRPADEPMPTVTTGSNIGLVVPLGHTHRGNRARSMADPLPTQGRIQEAALLAPSPAFLSSYYRTVVNRPVTEPMPAQTGHDRHSLVAQGEAPSIEDCGFRMLDPQRELKPGMGFRRERAILGCKRDATQLIGQAVAPPISAAIWGRIAFAWRGGRDEESVA